MQRACIVFKCLCWYGADKKLRLSLAKNERLRLLYSEKKVDDLILIADVFSYFQGPFCKNGVYCASTCFNLIHPFLAEKNSGCLL